MDEKAQEAMLESQVNLKQRMEQAEKNIVELRNSLQSSEAKVAEDEKAQIKTAAIEEFVLSVEAGNPSDKKAVDRIFKATLGIVAESGYRLELGESGYQLVKPEEAPVEGVEVVETEMAETETELAPPYIVESDEPFEGSVWSGTLGKHFKLIEA